jgi:putative nucleotidyltransferase with HDIG domain
MDIIKPLVLAMKVFTRFDLDQAERFAMSHLWDHSLRTASCARRIADAEHADSADTDAAFMAGLFHDVGKAVLARQLPEPFDRIEEQIAQGRPRLDAERDALQATHAEVGAYLLGVWGLIDPVVDAVAYHHQPARSTRCEGFSPLTAVHVANVFCRSRAGGNPPDAWTENLDRTYLETVGLDGRIDHWGQAMAAGPEGQPHHV